MTDQVNQEEKLPELNEQDLLDLNIGIVPHEPIAPPLNTPIPLVDGTAMTYMHDHIQHWFGEYIYKRVINLPQAEKDRYFEMIYNFGDILAKIINDDNNIMFEYAQGNEQPWLKLENHAKVSNMVIDYERPKQLIKEFEEWKVRKGL